MGKWEEKAEKVESHQHAGFPPSYWLPDQKKGSHWLRGDIRISALPSTRTDQLKNKVEFYDLLLCSGSSTFDLSVSGPISILNGSRPRSSEWTSILFPTELPYLPKK